MLPENSIRNAALALLAAATLVVAGFSVARAMSRGMNGFGMAYAYVDGRAVTEIYSKGYFCDTSVSSKASSGCEVGADALHTPPGHHDTEYAVVPVGFTPPDAMQMHCPPHLVCIDHPATLDQTRVAKPIAMAMKMTVAAVLPMLANMPTPGHDHYLTTMYNGRPQWWHLEIIPVTSLMTYNQLRAHRSYAYAQSLIASGNKTIMKAVPTNVYFYFAVVPNGSSMRM